MISERSKRLAVRRRRGQVLGLALRSKAQQREMRARGGGDPCAAERAQAYRVHIEWRFVSTHLGTGRPISFGRPAQALMRATYPPRGAAGWTAI